MMFAAVAVLGGGMLMSDYQAKSDTPDSEALGGYATSNNASWSMADVAIESKGVTLLVKKNDCCGPSGECANIVVLSNGTSETLWMNASDSRLPLIRQAKNVTGEWQSLEYRVPATCGNSFHRVALGAGRAFVWDVPSTSGPIATKARYALFGAGKPIYSNEFDCTLSLDAFVLPGEYVKDFKLSPDGLLARQ